MGFQYDPKEILRSQGQDPDEGKILKADVRIDAAGEPYIVILLDCGIGGIKKWSLPVADLDLHFESEATKGESEEAESQDEDSSDDLPSDGTTDEGTESGEPESDEKDEEDELMTSLMALNIKDLRALAKEAVIKLPFRQTKTVIANLLIEHYNQEDVEAETETPEESGEETTETEQSVDVEGPPEAEETVEVPESEEEADEWE